MTVVYNAIVTKYIGQSEYKPSRIKATCEAGSITVSYDHGLNGTENHIQAAKTLANKIGWHGKLITGAMPGNKGYCHVFESIQRGSK